MAVVGPTLAFVHVGVVSTKLWLVEEDIVRSQLCSTPPSVAALKRGHGLQTQLGSTQSQQAALGSFVGELWVHNGISTCERITLLTDVDEDPLFRTHLLRLFLGLSPRTCEVTTAPHASFVVALNSTSARYPYTLVVDLQPDTTLITPVADGVVLSQDTEWSAGFATGKNGADLGEPLLKGSFAECLRISIRRTASWMSHMCLTRQPWCVVLTGDGCDIQDVREVVCLCFCESFPQFPVLWS